MGYFEDGESEEYAILILVKDLSIHQIPSLASIQEQDVLSTIIELLLILCEPSITIEVTLVEICRK